MKHTFYSFLLFGVLAASCTKEHTCYCEIYDNNVVIDTTSIIVRGSQSKGSKNCDEYEEVYQPSLISEAVTKCQLK